MDLACILGIGAVLLDELRVVNVVTVHGVAALHGLQLRAGPQEPCQPVSTDSGNGCGHRGSHLELRGDRGALRLRSSASVRWVRLSRNAWALAVALAVNVALIILLTPLGFETRPATDLKTVGYLAIGTIFAALALDVASIALLFRRARLASILAIVGSIFLFFPIFGDQTGSFFSLPIPPVIHTLEYIDVVVLLVALFLASKVYRESKPSLR